MVVELRAKLKANTCLLESKLKRLSCHNFHEKSGKRVAKKLLERKKYRESTPRTRWTTRLRSVEEVSQPEESHSLTEFAAWRASPLKRSKLKKFECASKQPIYSNVEVCMHDDLRPSLEQKKNIIKPHATCKKMQTIVNLALSTANENCNKGFPCLPQRSPLVDGTKSQIEGASTQVVVGGTVFYPHENNDFAAYCIKEDDLKSHDTANNEKPTVKPLTKVILGQLKIQLILASAQTMIEFEWNNENLDRIFEKVAAALFLPPGSLFRSKRPNIFSYCGVVLHSEHAWQLAIAHALRKNNGFLRLNINLPALHKLITTRKANKPALSSTCAHHITKIGRLNLSSSKKSMQDDDQDNRKLFYDDISQFKCELGNSRYQTIATELERRLSFYSSSFENVEMSPPHDNLSVSTAKLQRKRARASSVFFLPSVVSGEKGINDAKLHSLRRLCST